MKPELPFAMCFSFPRAMLGSTQLAQCLDMSPVYTTGSFACIGTREYLGGGAQGGRSQLGGVLCGEGAWDAPGYLLL